MADRVTFLMTDVEGSTRLWETRPDEMRSATARHDELVGEIVSAHRGTVRRERAAGDSAFALFDSAVQAIEGALALQRAIEDERWPGGLRLRIRAGLHTGATELYGPVVNRCARVRDIGHGAQTLISEATATLASKALPAGAALIDMGVHRLKDLAEPEHVYQLAHPLLPHEFPPLRAVDEVRHNLPEPNSAFVGSPDLVAQLASVVAARRALTLTGPGGIGKTRLALEVARRLVGTFADGVWFVELASLTRGPIAPALAAVLGLRDHTEADALDAVVAHLQSRHALLVLDNCEHLLDAVADVAEAVLYRAPRINLLATSRESLRLPGEQLWPVAPLTVPIDDGQADASDAMRLFVDRARTVSHDFAVTTDNRGEIARLCRRLEGLPLALEMAAARTGTLSVREIAASFEDVLGAPLVAGAGRHDTLRAAISWSYDLLDAQDKALFRALGVFAGGLTLQAAEAVAPAVGVEAPDVLDVLDRLTSKSLLVADTVGAEARYRQLESLREFSREQMGAEGELGLVRARHLAWFSPLAETASRAIEGPDHQAALDLLATEYDNCLAAMQWPAEGPSADLQVRLVSALGPYWYLRGRWSEGRQIVHEVIPRTPRPWSARAFALGHAAGAAERLGDPESAEQDWAEVVSIVEKLVARLADPEDELFKQTTEETRAAHVATLLPLSASASTRLGAIAANRGDVEGARGHFERVLRWGSSAVGESVRAYALQTVGALNVMRGQALIGREQLSEAADLYRARGDAYMLASVLQSLGLSAYIAGDVDAAIESFESSVELSRALQSDSGVASGLASLADAFFAVGRDGSAHVDEAMTLAEALGEPAVEALALRAAAEGDRQTGNLIRARERAGRAVARVEALDSAQEAFALVALARIDRDERLLVDATSVLDRAVQLAKTASDPYALVEALTLLGGVKSEVGDPSAFDDWRECARVLEEVTYRPAEAVLATEIARSLARDGREADAQTLLETGPAGRLPAIAEALRV